MKVRSFAKINLGIEVLDKREDDYHEIKTLFQTIDLSDILEFRLLTGREVRLSGSDPTIPWDERNLVFRAARLFQQSFPNAAGVEVRVTKNIPAGRGLGGGSGNAALALFVLNKLWELGLDRKNLQAFARRLGADVPYFLEGGLCLGEGRGDELSPLDDLPVLYCILALPSFPISTSAIYGRLRLTSPDKDSKINRFLARREFGLLENRLEETIFSLYPRLKAIKSSFLQKEAVLSLVSGTGSAVFGLFQEREKADRALAAMEWTEQALLVETLSRERYWKRATAGV
ncbi:MAG TPA: 4-(cytidine 5'-diphospho)-2-C-methyl-D-erythritol kinase [Candidatus Desulfaltia sp.]|nr:4-(cytidine 5'-diphospho)-2-C-methyl-D-erythritol kinase [Candidatus Desulfaltia sp.]